MNTIIGKIICKFNGHDFGSVVTYSPNVLVFCRRCGEEIAGRKWEDLEPMSEADREEFEEREYDCNFIDDTGDKK